MYLCQNCQQPINYASAVCPYCGAVQNELESEGTRKSAQPRTATKLIFALIVVVVGIWAIIWFALPLRFQNPQPGAERAAVDAVRSLQQGLATYANGAGNFPPNLEALGELARDAAQSAMAGGYSIRYTPSHLDADGNAHAYSLLVQPGNYGYESLYTDQTGVIHFTRENRPATPQDPSLK